MEVETYQQAKFLQENIGHLRIKKLQIEQMKKRKDDEEFNTARELAHDAICYSIGRLEKDFNSL